MREAVRNKERLIHILKSISQIEMYMNGKSKNDIVNDNMLKHAVTWNIMIIGEAANKLTKEFCNLHSDINWRGITGMRNVLVHDYYQIDDDELWYVIDNDLKELKPKIEQFIKE